MKKVLIGVLALVMVLGVVGCAPARDKYDLLVKATTRNYDFDNIFLKTDDEEVKVKAILLGYSEEYPELIPDADTVKQLIENESADGYLELLKDLSSFSNQHTETEEEVEGYEKLYEYFIQAESEHIIELDINYLKNNQGTYYIDNPSAEPQSSNEAITGTFNDTKNGNEVYSERRTTSQTVTYYGDFAIVEGDNWHYDEGRYEWSNGKFYDEKASWNYSKSRALWYKGVEIYDVASDAFSYEYDPEKDSVTILDDFDPDSDLVRNPIMYSTDKATYFLYYNVPQQRYYIQSVDND